MKNAFSFLVLTLIFLSAYSCSDPQQQSETNDPNPQKVLTVQADSGMLVAATRKEVESPGSPEAEVKKPSPVPDAREGDSEKAEAPFVQEESGADKPEETTPPLPAVREKEVATEPSVQAIHNHQAWNDLLKKHVDAKGKVNYKGFKSDINKLNAYLKDLSDNPIEKAWSDQQKMAYWINAYNAFTVKLIVDNYPLSSITELHGGKPWDVSWISLGNQTYSLNNIENDILRPRFKDARIHFAVNCAARSCPPLLNRAWTASTLERFFDQQASAFINNPSYNQLSAERVQISKIFEWYAGDFGNIIEYLNRYSDSPINPGAEVSYLEYDWSLNE